MVFPSKFCCKIPFPSHEIHGRWCLDLTKALVPENWHSLCARLAAHPLEGCTSEPSHENYTSCHTFARSTSSQGIATTEFRAGRPFVCTCLVRTVLSSISKTTTAAQGSPYAPYPAQQRLSPAGPNNDFSPSLRNGSSVKTRASARLYHRRYPHGAILALFLLGDQTVDRPRTPG